MINGAFMKLTKRAEMVDRAKLVSTFVDVGPLFHILSGIDHQVMYGRRGVGKTHAVQYLAEDIKKRGSIPVYIDMRLLGSTGGMYADSSVPESQRATRLLVDTIRAIHEELLAYFIESTEIDLAHSGPLLDQLADATTNITVVGTVERYSAFDDVSSKSVDSSTGIEASKEPAISLKDTTSLKRETQLEGRLTESGIRETRISFGALGKIFADLAQLISPKRVWVLLDEWSSVPIEIQPYLADLIRRAILPIREFTVKIAAIEQRTRFKKSVSLHDYIGLELGADVAADLNLDDFVVFDHNKERARNFFQDLVFKHFQAAEGLPNSGAPNSAFELVRQGFTQNNAFDEFVRATEGVPRDAINILGIAARKAVDNPISVNHIRAAAKDWYQQDKEDAPRSRNEAHQLLRWIIDEVIGQRKARAFLINNEQTHELIDFLFDSRVLHILKKNISSKDTPGLRYDCYKLDYGCYIDLINTARSPQMLLPGIEDREVFAEVPSDDYRAIRRAILDIDDFFASQSK
jgi:hypothetical protein